MRFDRGLVAAAIAGAAILAVPAFATPQHGWNIKLYSGFASYYDEIKAFSNLPENPNYNYTITRVTGTFKGGAVTLSDYGFPDQLMFADNTIDAHGLSVATAQEKLNFFYAPRRIKSSYWGYHLYSAQPNPVFGGIRGEFPIVVITPLSLPVPEPTALALFGLGAGLLAVARRRG